MDSSRIVQGLDIWALNGDWRNGRGPLWSRLADAIENAVLRSELSTGLRLPSERILADHLGIGRSTVVRAMHALAERDVVQRAHGSGTFIRPSPMRDRPRSGPRPLSDYYRTDTPVPTGLGPAVIPSASTLPSDLLPLSADDLVHESDSDSGYVIPGLPSTRRAIAAMLCDTGVETSAESIIVTTGATQATSLVLDHLLRPDDTVIVERRAYPTTLRLLRRTGARVIAASDTDAGYTDTDAMRRLALQHRAVMLVVMSTCNAATGATIPGTRQDPLLDCASRGITVVDDRALADYHPQPAPPPLAARMTHPNIVTVGSLNKIYWGGLRLGWLHVHESLLHPLVRAKAAIDSGSSVPSQLMANRLLARHPEIAENRRTIATRARISATNILESGCPQWRIEGSPIGPTMWIRLPVRDTGEFTEFAHARGIVIGYGGDYRADGRPSQHIRLSLTNGPDKTARYSRDLADAWHQYKATHDQHEL